MRKSYVTKDALLIIAIIAVIGLLDILNHDLLAFVLISLTVLFVIFLFLFHYLSERGKW